MEGKGAYCWASIGMKSKYFIGESKDNAFNGVGKMGFRDGSIYKGKFNNNCMHSPSEDVEIQFANKDSYVGTF